MDNAEKAKKIVISKPFNNASSQDYAYKCAMEMAQWKDEQHEQSLIDLNCKLEEQQENYEELKKRYDEAVEREKIATKIINELRARK